MLVIALFTQPASWVARAISPTELSAPVGAIASTSIALIRVCSAKLPTTVHERPSVFRSSYLVVFDTGMDPLTLLLCRGAFVFFDNAMGVIDKRFG